MKKSLLAALVCACLCLFLCAFALASGVEQDEDGGTWDYDNGIYTDPSGKQYDITPGGVEENDSGSGTVQNEDGSMTVVTGDKDPVQYTEDGGMEVESGQVYYNEPEATREPLTDEEWKAMLDSVAARNGAETATVWIDPKTGTAASAQVVYMGIGRSCVTVNGQKQLVNTVDLKWETEAPEDKVLAVINAPREGYAWLRKAPNNKITNPKVQQCRTDSVVRVISTGKNYTLVDYNGMRGYVLTSSLEFFANDHTDFMSGCLSYNGKTTGKAIATAKSRDKSKKRLKDCKVGTPVTVFDIIEDWAYVDLEGFFCRVEAKYITLNHEATAASN